MKEVVIVSAVRTPIGRFGGSLKDSSAVELGKIVVEDALKRANIETSDIQQVIFGNVLQAGLGQNPARQIAIHAGVPFEVPAMTINEVCGSGLKAVMLGRQAIQLGEAEVVVVGGTENMSQAPFLMENHRFGHKFGNDQVVDSMINDGLSDAFGQYHMGITAENVAEQFKVSRKEQDAFAYNSQMKAKQAEEQGFFQEEIVPVPLKNGTLMEKDETIRYDTSMEKLERLKPAFKKDGTVTAGNASGINDGASALVLMSKERAEAKGIPYLATIKATAEIGIDPAIMGYAPYYAVKEAVKKSDYSLSEIDLFQLNEAFASQSVAVVKDLKIDPAKTNIYGGAIALGHPIGASGARVLTTLLYELKQTKQQTGVASLCIGGGLGVAMVVERH
ncbi:MULTISPECIES: acetyl-CoA C-acetyltransferase [Carnobacterium]|uniref:acetyl-CoA C-acetyltransferase n=1 Tax=Carnobacterium TaxID=2747 RepID=UPI0010728BD3|nr:MULTISPECIES: acetyl-CoA C-acetyltransferase [Carnobacterium]MDT1940398.1 acetyl-CoA C-acetyltransferase [Carnobacterium divergens]MDT1942836.1 acetyl-CoA C-acetyltransferase [Carnobacterium divergens]MDT1948642.1 acetyl-CoA C-acetyltransferase [Carnobacterium divergens]MDT1951123.1 acetyl-CoA C-acetyltransferase [Carnobacterium divergens]MDT1956181.1 acetyl-CoA C-acetyltransferase [Carnobacterium divergens]